jgi:aspartate/methionine/tyrosine aminotransferase
MLSAFDIRRDLIVSELNNLPGVTCQDPGGAFYVFPNFSATGKSSNELQDLFLEQAGVACISGTSFGHFGEGHLRFSYANSLENIKQAMSLIREVVSS